MATNQNAGAWKFYPSSSVINTRAQPSPFPLSQRFGTTPRSPPRFSTRLIITIVVLSLVVVAAVITIALLAVTRSASSTTSTQTTAAIATSAVTPITSSLTSSLSSDTSTATTSPRFSDTPTTTSNPRFSGTPTATTSSLFPTTTTSSLFSTTTTNSWFSSLPSTTTSNIFTQTSATTNSPFRTTTGSRTTLSTPPYFTLGSSTRFTPTPFTSTTTFTCDPSTQFSCTYNGQCLPLANQCDGVYQCGDGSDETKCLSCRDNSTSFTCTTGSQCVPTTAVCNGYWNCYDGSDERSCPCPGGQFKCVSTGSCVPASFRCDNYNDCSDGSDELNCPCDENTRYRCANGQCVDISYRCSGFTYCSDGSDEWNCTTACTSPLLTCADGWCLYTRRQCIYCQRNWRCDGYMDCPDGTDELRCNETSTTVSTVAITFNTWNTYSTTLRQYSTTATNPELAINCTAPGQYKCNNGWCLSLATPCTASWCSQWDLRCDGYKDCPDNSDELNCTKVINRTCAPGEFSCNNGQCVSYSQLQCRYSTQSACSDDSDGQYCTCNSDEFQCADGKCIPSHYRCSTYSQPQCRDRSDQMNCTCTSPYFFQCADGVGCIDIDYRCNPDYTWDPQCSDKSDQRNCTCSSYQFQCADGVGCIDSYYRCNPNYYQNPLCSDGSDQQNCNCTQYQFKCTEDGGCIEKSELCDGTNQCRNGSDEENCPCRSYQFQCANGICRTDTYFTSKCNGYTTPVCPDGSDRTNCTCLSYQFQCADGGCVDASFRCVFSNCADGSDLWNCNCTEDQFKCSEDGSCISMSEKCNGYNNCRNGSDELNCTCPTTSLSCDNERCVDRSALCDGINNCGNYYDEINCTGCIYSDNSFTCQMGLCFPDVEVFCNGIKECPDGSDEPVGCETMCAPKSYRCNNGRCVLASQLCNQFNDCGDYSDESNCTCYTSQFKCNEAQCVYNFYWCDGYRDCPGGDDEIPDCKNICPGGGVRCNITGQCLSADQRCNGLRDCPDGSDEISCGCQSYQFQCSNGTCIPRDWLCDGTKDCPAGEDELTCNNCTVSQFQCRVDYLCISITQQCDGVTQCSDSSDESFCVSLGVMASSVPTTTRFLVVTYRGMPGSYVCSDNWTTAWSDLACAQMGLGLSLSWSNQSSARGSVLSLNTRGLPNAINLLTYVINSTCSSNQVISLTCSQPACGVRAVPADSVGPYIIDGDLAKRGAWPWQVSLFYQGSFTCGGSILNAKWILTAAHCGVLFIYTYQLTVRAGSIFLNDYDSSAKFWSVNKVIVNPAYDSTSVIGPGDIALLRLTSPITYTDTIRPICLPSPGINLAQFKVCVATGFGYTTRDPFGVASQYLMQGRMNILNSSTCYQSYIDHVGNLSSIANNIFVNLSAYSLCAGSYPSDISVCYGDSGGPLACKNQQDVWTVIGVTSWVYADCWGTIFTRVTAYVDWLQLTMQSNWIN